MTINTLLIWVIVGAITGIVIDTVAGGLRMGMLGAIVIGVLGAILSGWLFSSFLSGWISSYLGFLSSGGFIGIIAEALIGAVVLLLIFGIFRK
jgi:uncharacterized membrane protein YeaQ/YmgE (transglycosylase-associated protein family)